MKALLVFLQAILAKPLALLPQRNRAAIFTAVVGLALSAGVYWLVDKFNGAELQAAFTRQSTIRSALVEAAFTNALEPVYASRALFVTTKNIMNDEYQAIAGTLLQRAPSQLWMAWVPRVNANEREKFDESMKAEIGTGYKLSSLSQDGSEFVPVPDRKEYFPIAYLAVLSKNKNKVMNLDRLPGIDLGSIPRFKVAMDRARDTGEPFIIGVGLNSKLLGTPSDELLIQPIFRSGVRVENEQERRENLLGYMMGFVAMPIVIDGAMETADETLGDKGLANVNFAIKDLTEDRKNTHYSYHVPTEVGETPVSAERTKRYAEEVEFEKGGRKWFVTSTPTPTFFKLRATRIALYSFIAALISAVLATIYSVTVVRAGERKVADAAKKADENERLNDSIIAIMRSVSKLARGDLRVLAPVREDVTGALSDAINSMTESTAKTLASVNTSSEAMRTESKIGRETVLATAKGMNEVRGTIQETGKRIKRLGERSQEIGGIVKLIDDIAERTSVLALNANMQAAVAGEAGRGFRVVADEVQRLAERSKEATDQIAKLVTSIQGETNDTIATMERAIGEVVKGGELAEKAAEQVSNLEKLGNNLYESVQTFILPEELQSTTAPLRRAA